MTEKNPHILMLPSWHIRHGGFVRNQAQVLKGKGLTVNILENISLAITTDKTKYLTFPYNAFVSAENDLTFFCHYFRDFPKFTKINTFRWINNTVSLFEKYQKKFGNPDIIHVHSALWAGYAAFLIKEKYGIPYIITEHRGRFGQSCEYAEKLFKKWQTPLLEKAFSEAATIVPVSENQIPKIRSFLKKEVPIIPVSNVLDTDFFYYKKRKFSEKIRFVTTNSFDRAKAYDILLPAFDNACNEISNLELTIVGGKFSGNFEFESIWKTIKHKNNFRFVGLQDAEGVRNELWQANVFVLASRIEAQPVAVLEALSTGLPLVCTTVVPRAVATAENSIVVPVENKEKLTNAILEMAKNYQKYNGENISEHIKSIAGKDAFAKAIIEIYASVINEK